MPAENESLHERRIDDRARQADRYREVLRQYGHSSKEADEFRRQATDNWEIREMEKQAEDESFGRFLSSIFNDDD